MVEGPRGVEATLEAGAAIEVAFIESGFQSGLVDDLTAADVDIRRVESGVLERVLSTVSPQPIAAIVARPDTPGTPVAADEGSGPVIVLAGVSDPGNVGTIIRSAVAAGATAVVVGPGSADPFGPKAVRSSVGTIFEAEIHQPASLDAAISELRATGWTVLGAEPRGGTAHHLIDLSGPVALVLGGETAGLPSATAFDDSVTIPQLGPAESMNVAMAATVLLFEAARQRTAGNDP